MKNQPQTNLGDTSLIDQLTVILNNAKYTYDHFREFHETVLDLLSNHDLFNLSNIQLKNNQFFIQIVLNLLDAPQKKMVTQCKKSGYQKSAAQHHSLPEQEISHFTMCLKLSHVKTSYVNAFREDFNKLLQWINRVVVLKSITIEQMLDEFYSLGITGLKNQARLN